MLEKDIKIYSGCVFKLMLVYYLLVILVLISILKNVCKYLKNMFVIKRRKYYILKLGRDFRLNVGR